MRPNTLLPLSQFTALFGVDGVGKTSVSTEIAQLGSPGTVVLSATKPSTWPDAESVSLSLAEQEALINDAPPEHQSSARKSYSASVLAANYDKVSEIISSGRTVVNDSDILCKNLMWAFLDGESLSETFDDLTDTLARTSGGFLPHNVVYIAAPGDLDEQTEYVWQRLNQRGVYSSSDPISRSAIYKRISACEAVASYIDSVSEPYGIRLHRIQNEHVNGSEQIRTKAQALARYVLDITANW